MEWLKNNAVVVFIIIGLITYIEVRLSDLKADLKADNRELREELTTDIRELRTELKGDIKEIRSLLVTYILKNNDGSTGPLALNSKKSGLKPQKTAKSENKPATPQKTAKALPDKPIKPTKPTAKKIQKTGFLKGAALELFSSYNKDLKLRNFKQDQYKDNPSAGLKSYFSTKN